MNDKRIYLDYAAATPVDPAVISAMAPYWSSVYANPGAIHADGDMARQALEGTRARIAQVLHVRKDEVYFTGSTTEANNLALEGLPEKGHIVVSAFEHASVLEPIKELERKGFSVTYIKPNTDGVVRAGDVIDALREDTVLVSLMYVQNELGSIQPISKVGRAVVKARGNTAYPLFHVDAAQASTILSLDVTALRVDLLTLGAGKCYGPKGVGVLMKRSFVSGEPMIRGGGQEGGLRSGTEAVPLCVGFAEAFVLAQEKAKEYCEYVASLRDHFISAVEEQVPEVVLNGVRDSSENPSIANLSFLGCDAEQLVVELDVAHISVSATSACNARGLDEHSYVLEALIDDVVRISSAVRFSFGKQTTKEELEVVVRELVRIVPRLRAQAKVVAS